MVVKKADTDIFEVFFRRKPAMILVALRKNQKNRYGSVLAKEVDCTYSHAVKILQEMEKAKLKFNEIITNKIQKELSLKIKKIYPLALCEIRRFEVLPVKK